MTSRPLLIATLLLLCACGGTPEEGARTSRGDTAILVETIVAHRGETSRIIERSGTLRPLREVRLSLQQEGVLLELPFHEGDVVSQGTHLAALDDTLPRAQLKQSQAQRQQAEQDLHRLKRLQGSSVVSDEELARASTALEVARAQEEELTIRLQQSRLFAPFDGIISERLAEPGDALPRLTHVLTLIDTQALYTELHISELELPGLRLGDPVSLSIDALGEQAFMGTIARIHPSIDSSTRQGTLEVMLNPAPSGALPGQLCRATLQLRSQERLLVPYNALRRDNRGEFLFIVGDDNRVIRRAVISGLHLGEEVEVIDGLQPGERLVTRGFLGLGEGSQIRLGGGEIATP